MKKVVSISLNGIAYPARRAGLRRTPRLSRARRGAPPGQPRSRRGHGGSRTGHRREMLASRWRRTRPWSAPPKISAHPRGDGPGGIRRGEARGSATPDAAFTAPARAAAMGAQPRKRLFKIREGEMWGGVCNGIAAYLGVDVTWVRIATVRAHAVHLGLRGARVLRPGVHRALCRYLGRPRRRLRRAVQHRGIPRPRKKKVDDSGESQRWRREWRRQQRHWQRQWDHMNEQVRQTTANAAPKMGYAAHAATAVFLPIAAIVGRRAVRRLHPGARSSWSRSTRSSAGHFPHAIPMWVGIVGFLHDLLSSPRNWSARSGTAAIPPASASRLGARCIPCVWICFAALLLLGGLHLRPGHPRNHRSAAMGC